ncbi:MAG: hypothetical protein MSA72_19110 [Lachnospiraceae bacterium]|nr:hypothetical protein [Lachnospiraceae bacterium]
MEKQKTAVLQKAMPSETMAESKKLCVDRMQLRQLVQQMPEGMMLEVVFDDGRKE